MTLSIKFIICYWALGIGHWASGIGHWALVTNDNSQQSTVNRQPSTN
ncbi:MAG: hypothetical protein QQW96_11380 [Tychonema bourrellyi B0820]|nr:hypothetical protein [Tychonema bourrellyi]MDQ2098240.1 hypothetical protein [Tychonema bourrellyi B0820]